MDASRTFSREAGLLTADVKSVVDDVTAAGGSAAMAMLGETVVALETGLTDAGYDPAVTRIHPGGATVQEAIE
jgi:pantoate kinase